MKVTLEQVVNMNYTKYSNMIDIVNTAYAGSDATTINIYIDMYSVVKSLYFNDNYLINDYSALTSCIINMCAHYREFFRTRYKTESRIFIVYSKNCSFINNQFYPEYNHKNCKMFNSNKKIDDMINNNIQLLETLCPYLPDIHFINGTFETGVWIYDLICRMKLVDNSPHLIITKDPYNYQLIPMSNDITILRPKKVNGQDISYYINSSNAISVYLNERKISQNDTTLNLSPGLLSLIMALSSVPERNIKSLFNISTVIKIISNAVSEYKLFNGYNSDIEYIWDAIYDSNFNIGSTTFAHRFSAVDIHTQHSIFINMPESKTVEFKDLYDPDTVRFINNKYFKMTPLDLNRL